MAIRLPIEHVRVGDEVFHPTDETWCVVRTITAADNGFIVTFSKTFEGGVAIKLAKGTLVTVPRSPYICTACGQEGGGFLEDLCQCGARAWVAAGWVCPSCGRAMPESDACPCGAREEWVWGRLPPSTPLAARVAPPPPAPASPPPFQIAPNASSTALEHRILDAVRAGDLPNANAVVRQIGGRRQAVYATVKALLADGRLRFVSGVLRVGR